MTTTWAQYAHYNRLANQQLYEACARLSDEERRRDLGAFFRSVHGTLNHLVLGDRIWMTRFEGCLLYTSPSPRDGLLSRMPSSA